MGFIQQFKRTNPRCIVKQVNETQNSNIVLTNDSELFFEAIANHVYLVKVFFFWNSAANADIQTAFTIPAGATMTRCDGAWQVGNDVSEADWEVGDPVGTDGTDSTTAVYGRLVMGATSGRVNLVWAQVTTQVSDTIMFQGSTIEVCEQS